MEKADLRIDAMERRFDRRINGITKLLQPGMRMLVKTDTKLAELAEGQKRTDRNLEQLVKGQKRTDRKLEELADAQKATDRSLKAFIDSLRDGGNGR